MREGEARDYHAISTIVACRCDSLVGNITLSPRYFFWESQHVHGIVLIGRLKVSLQSLALTLGLCCICSLPRVYTIKIARYTSSRRLYLDGWFFRL